jgi:hypothetical protein
VTRVSQRALQVILTGLNQVIIRADVVDGGAWDWTVGARGCQGARGQVLPRPSTTNHSGRLKRLTRATSTAVCYAAGVADGSV